MIGIRKRQNDSETQLVSYDDLQQDQRPILCRISERNLIVFQDRVIECIDHIRISNVRLR